MVVHIMNRLGPRCTVYMQGVTLGHKQCKGDLIFELRCSIELMMFSGVWETHPSTTHRMPVMVTIVYLGRRINEPGLMGGQMAKT